MQQKSRNIEVGLELEIYTEVTYLQTNRQAQKVKTVDPLSFGKESLRGRSQMIIAKAGRFRQLTFTL